MLRLIIILLLLCGAGGGYYPYSRWGTGDRRYAVLITVVVFLFGGLR